MKKYFTTEIIILQVLYLVYLISFYLLYEIYFHPEWEFYPFPQVIYYAIQVSIFYISYISIVRYYLNNKHFFHLGPILINYVIGILIIQWLTNHANYYTDTFILEEKATFMDMATIYIAQFISITFWAFMIFINKYLNENNIYKQFLIKQKIKEIEKENRINILNNTVNNQLNRISALISGAKKNALFIEISNVISLIKNIYNYSDSELVSIGNELKLLEDYLEVQKKRYKYLDIIYKNGLGHELNDYYLPHLVLMTIVENSFKHGDYRNYPIELNITLKTDLDHRQFIEFNCRNRIGKKSIYIGGVGQKNIINRLDILMKRKYKYWIDQNEHYYTCNLCIYKNEK